jgi:hypothetical protein
MSSDFGPGACRSASSDGSSPSMPTGFARGATIGERALAVIADTNDMTAANRALASPSIDECLGAPAPFGDVPEGTAVLMLRRGGPAVATANPAIADRLAPDGRRVGLARIGAPTAAHPAREGPIRRSSAT